MHVRASEKITLWLLAAAVTTSFGLTHGNLLEPPHKASLASSTFCSVCFLPRPSLFGPETSSRRPSSKARGRQGYIRFFAPRGKFQDYKMGGDDLEKQPTLIWDVMSTLVYDPFFVEVPEFFGIPLKQLYKEKNSEIWTNFEKGKCSEQDLFDDFFLDKRNFDGRALVEMINDRYEWLPGMEELMAELHAEGHSMHILSNYPVWWNNIEAKLKISKYAQWSFVSCDLGVRKPDAQVFSIVEGALDLPSPRCLLVDDSEANVEGARARGWDAILFRGAEECRMELCRRGFLGASVSND